MKTGRILLWTLAGACLLTALLRVKRDTEILDLLPGELPVVQGLKLYQQNFANGRELILTVSANDAGQAESTARSLAELFRAQTNLVSSVVWQPGWMERPVLAAELIAYLWFNQPPELFGAMAGRLTGTNKFATLADTRDQLATSMSPLDLMRLGYDPYNLLRLPESAVGGAAAFGDGQDLFASGDGRFRILFVQAKPDISNYRAARAWFGAIKTAAEQWRGANPVSGVRIGFTGAPAFVSEISSGMEFDMTSSIGATSVIIAILFWLAHRRWKPMLWLLTLLVLILLGTLAIGGLLFAAVNVVSLGFAAILLGLAVDYAVVHYQEAIASPDAMIPEIRRAIGPSIFWAAVTTISAFLVLNLGGLPGLAQLGTLVAVGVGLSALVMLFAFLPPLFRDRELRRKEQIEAGTWPKLSSSTLFSSSSSSSFSNRTEKARTRTSLEFSTVPAPHGFTKRRRLAFAATGGLVISSVVFLSRGLPALDRTANALRPRNSPAYTALDEIKLRLAKGREPLWVITHARDEMEVARRLERAGPLLEQARTNGLIQSFTLPTPLWPRPDHQAANRVAAAQILRERQNLREAAVAAGFATNSLIVTEGLLDTWRVALTQTNAFWPTNEVSRWIMERVAARPREEVLAVGFVFPATNSAVTPAVVAAWSEPLAREGFAVSGWELLGPSILERVRGNLWRTVVPMVLLVLLSLWFAFRRPVEIVLSLAVLAVSGLCLLATMRVCGWSWNLMNLMGLPLMLGSGVDYSIFMQLALRRHAGDLAAAHRSVGRALLLCGGTAVAGFGSLSWSSNAGMASLGAVCAVGIGCNMLVSVCLLPVWWKKFTSPSTA